MKHTTLRDIKAADDSTINSRVAQLLGGVFKPCECGLNVCTKYPRWHWADNTITDDCPDYVHDLNACHQMEEAIPSNGMRWEWHLNLHKVCGLRRGQSQLKQIWLGTHISARHRCEAFILTMEF